MADNEPVTFYLFLVPCRYIFVFMKEFCMKKLFIAALLAAFAAVSLVAQEGGADVSLLNVGNYSKLFLNGAGILSRKYRGVVSSDDYNKIAILNGDKEVVDTPLEIALLSTCAGVVDIRPVEAVKMLGTGPEADLKLGAAAYMEMQAARFLGGDPAPYAAEIKFITDRGRVTEADIRGFMAQGIAAAVDAEFNKVEFLLDKTAQISYGAVLTRDIKNNKYILSYKGYSTNGETKTLYTSALDALLAEMRKNTADFSQMSIDQVREKATLIPAVVIAETGTTDAILGTTKNILTNFHLNPTTATCNNITALDITYQRNYERFVNNDFFELTRDAFANTLYVLNLALAQRVYADFRHGASLRSQELTAALRSCRKII
jgi:hypothetical protein